MTNDTSLQIATNAIRFLSTVPRTSSRNTSSLLSNLGIPKTRRSMVLQILHALADSGLVGRRGQGSYRWSDSGREDITEDQIKAALPKGGGRRAAPAAPGVTDEQIDALVRRIAALEEQIDNATTGNGTTRIEVVVNDVAVELPDGVLLPSIFRHVLELASCRKNIMLVGPAGCGKSHVGELVAKTLNLRFASVSCTAGMSEAHLLGRSIPNIATGDSVFQTTEFLECYENGGVFLLDEIDAADSNLLLAINSAIANGYCNVPARSEEPRALKHPDFVIIATANTFGRGADRSYVGRCQLDESTLDRFRIGTVECDYDARVEKGLCPDAALLRALLHVRSKIEENKLRRVMSTRFIKDAYEMRVGGGWTVDRILDVFFSGWSATEVAKCRPETSHDAPESPATPDAPSIPYSATSLPSSLAGRSSDMPREYRGTDIIDRAIANHNMPAFTNASPKQIEFASDIRCKVMRHLMNMDTADMMKYVPVLRKMNAKQLIDWYMSAIAGR